MGGDSFGAIPLGRFLWGDSFGAIAQTSQPRQTPTENFVKPINKTPTNPATKPIPLANNGIETLRVARLCRIGSFVR